MPDGIRVALEKYMAAYEHRSMPDLLAVWPDLQNQKKEFGKIKGHLTDPQISNEHVSLLSVETQSLKDDALVQCEREEHFSKTTTPQFSGGDLMRDRSPAQNPTTHSETSTVKKKEKIWVKLHKDQENWIIVSVSDKQLSF